MLPRPTSRFVNQVIVPGSLLWRREKRALLRRWKRMMVLPETVLLITLLIGGYILAENYGYHPGRSALAAGEMVANRVLLDGMPSQESRRVHGMQDRLRQRPEDLLVLSSEDVIQALSRPDLQRREGLVTILQFRGASCVLDLYVKDGQDIPVHYEVRPRMRAAIQVVHDDMDVRAQDCIGDILSSRRL